jgi:hypothetical protein
MRHKKFGVSLTNLDPVRLGEASEAYKLSGRAQKGHWCPFSLLSIPHLLRQERDRSHHSHHRRRVLGASPRPRKSLRR